MNTNKVSTMIRWMKRILATALAAVLFVIVLGGTTPPQGREVLIAREDAGLALVWRSISNAAYRVEQRTNLLSGAWNTTPPWAVPGDLSVWQIPGADLPSQFFRVLFPTPQITGGEPSFVPEAGGTTVYVTGEYFYEGDQIRVDGVLLTNVVFISHNLMSGELPDLAPGLHRVVLSGHSGGWSVALPDALQVSPPFERTVQGPPEWPLAGPAPTLDWRGHQTVLKSHGSGIDNECDGVSDIRLYSGEVRQQVVDLAVPGRGLDFVWGRTYRSRTGVASSQGTRWSHSYDVRCIQNNGGTIDVYDGSGRKDLFRLQSNDTYACPELFREGTLDQVAGTFRLTFADTGYWEFCPFDAASPQSGKLARIVDRKGNTMTLNYDPAGRLTEIVDDLGRINTVAYTTADQVASVTDFSGRTVIYAYYGEDDPDGCPGDLKSATSPAVIGTSIDNDFPVGKTTTYTYTTNGTVGAGSLLLAVVDGLGQTNVQCTYDLNPASPTFARCASIQYGANSPTCVTYLPQTPAPDNRFAALRCVVNDSEGNVSEHDFDQRNRCVALREYTGRAVPGQPVTTTENRPANKLRVEDPALYETTWNWNNDSLCIACTLPRGERVEWAYQSDLDSTTPARFRANLRTERCIAAGDLDGDGLDDIAVTSFEHDPRFGSSERVAVQGFIVNARATRQSVQLHFQPEGTKGVRLGVGATAVGATYTQPSVGKIVPTVASLAIQTKGTSAKRLRKKGAKVSAGKTPVDAANRYVMISGSVGSSASIGDGDCDGERDEDFVTRAVNARGFETRCEYDAHGNQTVLTQHGSGGSGEAPLAREDFEYNTYGQLTAHVHAEDAQGLRRRDACVYYGTGAQAGYLAAIVIDEPGVHLTSSYQYDAYGNVTNTVDPRGTATSIEVNALNQVVARVTQGTSPSERAASRCYYDAANNLVRSEIENRDGNGTLNPTNGWFATVYDYDALYQPTRMVEADGSLTNTFVYNGNGQLVLARSPLAVQGGDPFHATGYTYDERGLLLRETRAPDCPLQSTTQYDYDANGSLRATLAGIEDGDGGHVTAYVTDGRSYVNGLMHTIPFGRCSSIVDPMGNETRYEYDLNGNLTNMVLFGETTDLPGSAGNIRLRETRYGYDALDRVAWYSDSFFDIWTDLSINDGGRDTAIAYAPNGLVTAITNDRGSVTTFAYDTAHRLTEIVDAKTNRVDYAYDANNNLLSATVIGRNDLGGLDEVLTRTFRYDALDRPVAEWDNVGNTNNYAYDSRGNRVRHIDALGFNLEGDFDSVSRPTSNRKGVGGSAQSTTRCIWDGASRLVADIDANTNTTTYLYDSLNRLVCTTLADGTSQTNAYDVHGNLVWTRDANGTEISMTYDAKDRCVQKNIIPGVGVASDTTTESYHYDGLSHLVQAANDHTTVTRAYNSLGDCVHESTSSSALGFNPKEIGCDRVFDAHGLLLSQTMPSGRVVEYSYNENDQPVWMGWRASAAAPLEPLAAFAYAGSDRLARVTRANGTQTDYTYSGLIGVDNSPGDYGWGQVQRICHTLGGTAPLDEREFAYDRNQNKTLRALLEPFFAYGQTTRQELAYDSLNRLLSSATTANHEDLRYREYTFDAAGNRTSLKLGRYGSPEPYLLDPTLPEPGDFQVNQYTSTPFDTRQYDANGNLHTTAAGGVPLLQFVYDYADRLVAVHDASGLLAAYAYDALDRRIGKVTYDGLLPMLTNRYHYAGNQLIEEGDGDGAVLQTSTHLEETLELAVERVGKRASARPQLLESSVALINSNGAVLYTHSDDQGTLLALTDANGIVVERFDYDDYGAPSFLTPDGMLAADSDGQPLRASAFGAPELFQGMYWDAETGLYRWKEFRAAKRQLQGNPRHRAAYMDPKTGQCLGQLDLFHCWPRASAVNNPYSLKKEEGGRHTPFNKRVTSGTGGYHLFLPDATPVRAIVN